MKMGGMERASVNLANALRKENQNITYISFFKQEHFFKLNEDITLIEPKGFNEKSLSFIKTIFWLRNTVKRLNPDRIIVFNKLYGAITCFALAGSGYRVYVTERSSPLYSWPGKQKLMIDLLFTLVKPYGVMAQTNIAKTYQEKYFGPSIKIDVVPNALREVKTYPEVKREKVVLAVGRLNDTLKGFDRLLEAFSLINTEDWVITIAGGKENEDASLSKIILEKDIGHKVRFLDKVKELDTVFASASIFVIPSRSEGFPNALCEAMAAGLPCISFDFIAGPSDIITHNENGILVKDGDVNALSFQIEQLMQNESERKRLGMNALEIRKKYSSAVITKKIIKFLE